MSLPVTVTYEPEGSPPGLGKTKISLLVSRLQDGAEVSREVYTKAKDHLKQPVDDYILYWPERKVWILPEKPIGRFHLEAGAKLEYRKRKRCIKLRFLDASSKLLMVDETRPVKRLVEDLCEQLRIDHHEELSLVVAGDYAVQKHHPAKNKSLTRVGSASPMEAPKRPLKKERSITGVPTRPIGDIQSKAISPSIRRKRPGSASKKIPTWSSSKVKKQISKKHQIRLDTPWLDPSKTLAEQEVTESDELILMYRFYYHMQLQRNSANVEMLYKQARATYLAGELLCSPNDMVRLSAILCQIAKGDYSKHKYNPDFISTIQSLIAPPKCKIKAIAKQITSQHASLEGVAVADAKCWFIKLWSSLELFGMEFLSCTNMDTKEKGLIGISKNKMMFLSHKDKKNTFWDIDKLTHWTHDPGKDIVCLTLSREGERQPEILNLHLPEYSGVLADCLQCHREISDAVPDIMRAASEYQFDDEMESALSVFATQTKRDAKVRPALNAITYQDVYWASKIENPMLSEEELAHVKKDSWENPVFDNMDQLMDERFNFLDFESTENDTGVSHAHPQQQNTHLSAPHTSNRSPLTVSRRSGEMPGNPLSSSSAGTVLSHKVFHDGAGGDGGVVVLTEHSRKSSSESGSGSVDGSDVGRGSEQEDNDGIVPSEHPASQLTVR